MANMVIMGNEVGDADNGIMAADGIAVMPLPKEMFLPLSVAAKILVDSGQFVERGQLLAEGTDCADLLAPADGIVLSPQQRQLAVSDEVFVLCLPFLPNSPNSPMLDTPIFNIPPVSATSGTSDSPINSAKPANVDKVDFLKRMGIIGLGGAGMPSWRKYRTGVHTLLINGLESDDAVFCDRALLAMHAKSIVEKVRFCADMLDIPQVVIAIRDDSPCLGYGDSVDSSVTVESSDADDFPDSAHLPYSADYSHNVTIRRFNFSSANQQRDKIYGQGAFASLYDFLQGVLQTESVVKPSASAYSSASLSVGDYALGAERMLIRILFGLNIPPESPPADYGVLSFNLGTILAVYDALKKGLPMFGRVLSVHYPMRNNNRIDVEKHAKNNEIDEGSMKVLPSQKDEDNRDEEVDFPHFANKPKSAEYRRRAVFVPFGATLSDVAAFIGALSKSALSEHSQNTAKAGGVEARAALDGDAVICARTNAVHFLAAAAAAAAPCIRCGDCLPACPEGLSPLRLFALWEDGEVGRMQREERLAACILCRRCDAVCPSGLPLADAFAAARRRGREALRDEDLLKHRSARYAQHLHRVNAPRPLARLNPVELAKEAQLGAAERYAVTDSNRGKE